MSMNKGGRDLAAALARQSDAGVDGQRLIRFLNNWYESQRPDAEARAGNAVEGEMLFRNVKPMGSASADHGPLTSDSSRVLR